MIKTVISAEHFKEVESAPRGRYFVRVFPKTVDGLTYAVEFNVAEVGDMDDLRAQALDKAKSFALSAIERYDTSDNVNSFIVNGESTWLDKATRVGLVNSLATEKAAGKETSTLYLNGEPITASITTLESVLSQVELYAIDCYRQTEAHKASVRAMTDYFAVDEYDYTTGYPEKLEFTL